MKTSTISDFHWLPSDATTHSGAIKAAHPQAQTCGLSLTKEPADHKGSGGMPRFYAHRYSTYGGYVIGSRPIGRGEFEYLPA